MFGSTSSPDFAHGIINALCLCFRESHINQVAQGQLCVWLPELVTVLGYLQSILNGGGTQKSATYAQRLEVASPKPWMNEQRGGGISYSTLKNLRKKKVIVIVVDKL